MHNSIHLGFLIQRTKLLITMLRSQDNPNVFSLSEEKNNNIIHLPNEMLTRREM